MRLRLPALVSCVLIAGALASPARAELLVTVDKDTQTMTVAVDGQTRYRWPVSTGVAGYDTPNGSYKPFRMEASHFSREFDNAPMPHAVFFSQIGHAIHGTGHTKNLGRAASHGCVRLAPGNAATLYALVQSQKMANSRIVIEGSVNEPVASANRPGRAQAARQRGGYDDDDAPPRAQARRDTRYYQPAAGRAAGFDPFAGDPYAARRRGYDGLGW